MNDKHIKDRVVNVPKDVYFRVWYLSIVKFKEIIVSKDFEVENGVLGLERDTFLSIVRFINSSVLREVWLNISHFLFF
jgi:hypothetical protein